MKMNYEKLGGLVREARKANRLNQDELAYLLDLSRNYVAMIERGEANNLTLAVFLRLAQFLKLTPGALLTEVVEQEAEPFTKGVLILREE